MRTRFAGSVVASGALMGLCGILAYSPARAGTVGPLGRVIGKLEVLGGAAPGSTRGIPGKIVLTQLKTGGRFTYPTSATGAFDAPVPRGVYRITGFSPKVRANGREATCAGIGRVTVKIGDTVLLSTTRVNVVCNVK